MATPQIIQCTTACEVTLLVEPGSFSLDRLGDYSSLFYLLLVAAVVIGCAKGLANLFWTNHDKD